MDAKNQQNLAIGDTVEFANPDGSLGTGYLLTVEIKGTQIVHCVEVDGMIQEFQASDLTPIASVGADDNYKSLQARLIATANISYQVDSMKSKLAMLRHDFIQEIKKNESLSLMQETIDELDVMAREHEKHFKLAKSQVSEQAVLCWNPSLPKTMLGGAVVVKEHTDKVTHWDEDKALDFALNVAPDALRTALLKPNQKAFEMFAGQLNIPDDVMQFDTTYTASIISKKLIEFVTLDAVSDDDSNDTDSKDKNVLEPNGNDSNGKYSDVPF